MTHPLPRVQKLMTHPLSAPAHPPPPILFDQSLNQKPENESDRGNNGEIEAKYQSSLLHPL